jgi:type II secretory ATPase GspE/PulE/Tfp pilus assembly ATPase PilB-like protein
VCIWVFWTFLRATMVYMPYFDDSKTNAHVDELRAREEERATQTRAREYGYGYVNFKETLPQPTALRLIDEEVARAAQVVLFAQESDSVSLAVCNPDDPQLPVIIDLLTSRGFAVRLHLATLRSMTLAWEHYKDVETSSVQRHGVLDVDPALIKNFAETIHSQDDVREKTSAIVAEKSPRQTSMLISVIFGGALALDASDIHIEPEAAEVRVRYRLDGVLTDACHFDTDLSRNIIARLKILAGVKLNVRKEAQDGRFTFDVGTREVEVRTSVIPGAYGESLVMRLLDPDASNFNIEHLGLSSRMREVMEEELKRPNGAVLTTGPTGSGKTTALYSFLSSIHTPDIKIITLEDPIEYKLPGIVQTQVNREYTFELGLRTILRQDPDVILIGEIRDREVAETAMQAALTGHLVFSTLHTNSAVGAIARLVNLGVDTQMIANGCNVILGQRLVRTLCPECKKERELTTEEQKLVQRVIEQPTTIHTMFEAAGCAKCNNTGYKGRVGVYEAVQMDSEVKEALLSDGREKALLEAAKPQNIPTMQQDAVMKVLAGITSLDEVSRVLDLYHMG